MVARSDRDQVALAIRREQALRQWAGQKPVLLLDAVTNVRDCLVDVAGVMDHHAPDVAHGAAGAAVDPVAFDHKPSTERLSQYVLKPYRVACESHGYSRCRCWLV